MMPERNLLSRRDFFGVAGGLAGSIIFGKNSENQTTNNSFEAANSDTKLQIIESEVDLMSIPYDQYKEIVALISLPVDKVPIWTRESKPVYLSIRKIDYQATIVLGEKTKDTSGNTTYVTPDSGIATPQDLHYPLVLIYGHSRWYRIGQEFAKITKLDLGDLISVFDGNDKQFYFVVDEFQLSSETTIKIPQQLTLKLQTSAINYSEWLISRDDVEARIKEANYEAQVVNFFVFAKPVRVRVEG